MKKDPVDMSYAPKEKQVTAREELHQLQWYLMEDIRRWETAIVDTAIDAEKSDQDKADYLVALLWEIFSKVQQTRFDGWGDSQ
ncbi:hypothetical protein [Aquibacillus salsiterrae]|uniref:Uncharacterized protein n=1 Tax=Aquibacillus salsiterrae TaxID=2950439 RepID=A0A9X3WC38_9BACI|nr:hypothetical protein [Aquibacillus salsiterrae]MDC3416667.1 hypothetical protein [Aquibacillus salsiterrae]